MSRPGPLPAALAVLLAGCAGGAASAPATPRAPAPATPAAAPWKPVPPPAALATPPTAPPAVRTAALPNGLRLVAVEQRGRPLAVVTLLLPRGALTDPASALGASSLAVELLADFHEVDARGQEIPEEKSLRRLVVERGGRASFRAAADHAQLTIAGYAEDVGPNIRLLADAVQRPRHGNSSYRARRDARLDALEDLESWEPEALERALAEAAFGNGHPYARSELGSHATLSAMGLEDVVRQQGLLLVPDGATLLVVGDVAGEKVLADARAAFGRWQGRALPEPSVPPPPVRAGAVQMGLLPRRPAATLTVCAARAVADPRLGDAALEVLGALLGQGAGSRLQRALRDQSGLTYTASAGLVRRRQARALLACAPIDAQKSAEGLALFRKVLESARSAPPGEAELARARALCLAERDAAFDDPARTTATWVEAIALGRGHPRLAEERAALERVTAEEVWRLARELLAPGSVRWIVSGDPAAAARAASANGMGAPFRLSTAR